MTKNVKCKVCESHGFKSKVYVSHKTSFSSNKDVFHDEDGAYHVHDKNTYAYEYKCEKGHSWVKHEITACWCGYGKELAYEIINAA